MATYIESARGLTPLGYGCREPNPDCAGLWPCGLPSSSLRPIRGPARSACAGGAFQTMNKSLLQSRKTSGATVIAPFEVKTLHM